MRVGRGQGSSGWLAAELGDEESGPRACAAAAHLDLFAPAEMSTAEKTYNKPDNPFGLEEGEVPTIEDVAKLIRDGKAKRILIMVSPRSAPIV